LTSSDAVVDAEGQTGHPAGLAFRGSVETVRSHSLQTAAA